MIPNRQNRHAAFTLVELSIVLVILGLLVGGVLTGQSLIRAAELRSVSTQYTQYIAAVHTFRDKYFALPGDMTNATSFWGAAHATPATCVTTASTTALTCNGDGDGRLLTNGGSNEIFRFWQHLTNAGLLEGSYDGITHGSTSYSATRVNSPAGKLGNSSWFLYNWWTISGDGGFFDGAYHNTFAFGGLMANSWPAVPTMKNEEIWNLDTKMDDGKPATGKIRTVGAFVNCTDTSSNSNMGASYLLNNPTPSCAVLFPQAF